MRLSRHGFASSPQSRDRGAAGAMRRESNLLEDPPLQEEKNTGRAADFPDTIQ
jgi:hypothetical protein